MKIMFYINHIVHLGGAERVMCNLATQFSERGHECILVTSFPDEGEYVCGPRVRRVNLFDAQLHTGFLKRNIRLVGKLRHLLKKEQPDVLVSFMAEPNFRAIIASAGLKNKVLISVRNDPDKEYGNFLTRTLAKTLFRRADGIVFQTRDAQQWFPESIQKKSKIIFNQVDAAFYNRKFQGERHNIVTTGRLVPQKNHKMLIRAFASIADRVPDDLYIYGEGELLPELEALIAQLHMENRIFLPGSIKNVAETIQSAKLFVLSSDHEGMPNSLMEAMALGVPCISTDCPCGGPKMLLQAGGHASLVPVGDEKAMASAILHMISRKDLMEECTEENRRLSRQFAPEKIFGEWDSFIRQL